MTHIKRLFVLIVFAVVATATRMVVRYGVQGALDAVMSLAGLQPKDSVSSAPKPKKKPQLVTVKGPQQVPIIQQNDPTKTPALGPSAPSIAGPINAARGAAAASNRQLAEQTGQEAAPAKGARQNTPPATQTPAAPPPSAPAVVQQGTPSPAAPGSGPSTPDTKSAPNAVPANAKVAAAAPLPSGVRLIMPDTARKPVMRESFDYSRDSRRDPFISLMTTSDLRPTITDLRLTGILYDLSGRRPVAILRDVAGGQWRVTTGMTLGRMRVANIKPKIIIFTIEEFGFNRQDSLILGDTTRVRSR